MSWLSSLFGGDQASERNYQTLSNTGTQAIGQGQDYTGTAGNILSTLANGDEGAITKLLTPQINSIQKQTQQKVSALGQFGTRSGGTAAEAATAGDQSRGQINDMISGLRGNAISGLASLGTSLTGLGVGATSSAAQTAQQRYQTQLQMMSQVGQGIGGLVGKIPAVAGLFGG